MTTLERKKLIKDKIDFSDETTLDKIEKLLEEEIYHLSEEQLLRVNESRAEYERGESISDEEAQKEMEKWFREQEK